VIAIRDRQLVELAGPRIAYDDPDLDEHCLGALTREPVGKATHLVVTTTASTGASAVCLSEGRHVFALDAGQLVEVPGAPPPAAATDRVVDRTGAR